MVPVQVTVVVAPALVGTVTDWDGGAAACETASGAMAPRAVAATVATTRRRTSIPLEMERAAMCPLADCDTEHPCAPTPAPAQGCRGLRAVGHGMVTALVKTSWSLATGAFGAGPTHTAAARVGVPVPGQRNSSGLRVSDHTGWAVLALASRPM